jgi:hypothetical protein
LIRTVRGLRPYSLLEWFSWLVRELCRHVYGQAAEPARNLTEQAEHVKNEDNQ